MRMRETRGAGTKGGRRGSERRTAGGRVTVPRRRSQVEPRNGTEGRLHLLNWAQTCTPPLHPPSPFAFHPRGNYGLSLPPRLLLSPLFSPALLLFVIPSRRYYPPWNEVGMCKIVPRYALHHRVGSSCPLYFFLSLSFGRFYLCFTLHLPRFLSS